jgi:EAL domain-containing protein (putative c-di-GMP-specific phosphodiesterase class I)
MGRGAGDILREPTASGACSDGIAPPFEFTMAFQPVVDTTSNRIYAYEA